jgi:hyperosmotically inducible protein
MIDDAARILAGCAREAFTRSCFLSLDGDTMTYENRQAIHRSFLVLALSALALTLAACEERPSAERVGRSIDQTGEKLNQAARTAGDKLAAAGQAVDDTALAARVKAALIAAPGLKSSAIDVDAANGVVTLAGTTENPEKRDLAEQLASNVEGVQLVQNTLVIEHR